MKFDANALFNNKVKDQSKSTKPIDTKSSLVNGALSGSKECAPRLILGAKTQKPFVFSARRQESCKKSQSSKKEFEARQSETSKDRPISNTLTGLAARSNNGKLSNSKQGAFKPTSATKAQKPFVFVQSRKELTGVKKELTALPIRLNGDLKEKEPIERWDLVENDHGKHKYKVAKLSEKKHKNPKKPKKPKKDRRRKGLLYYLKLLFSS